MTDLLAGKTIVVGITGGIAAYKAAEVCSALVQAGAVVHVVMTKHATKFVGPTTFRALTGNRVITSLWEEPVEHEITHVSLPDKADVMLVVPATANIIGKIASGIADDMLSTMLMATKAPIILAPAMNNKMWENPVVQANVQRLKSLGYRFVGPESGRLACGDEGVGRLASVGAIINAVRDAVGGKKDLEGVRVIVTAGPTQEQIDAVRMITNRSSGKMGYAISQAAADRGATVVLISGPTSLTPPRVAEVVNVRTAAEMCEAVTKRLDAADVVIGAAAPADYAPVHPFVGKMKKTAEPITVELTPTPDIIAEVGKRKGRKIIVGFAAETEKLVENARQKLAKKNLDLVVANDVSRQDIGFDSDVNQVTLIGSDGSVTELPVLPKREVAHRILDWVSERLHSESEE